MKKHLTNEIKHTLKEMNKTNNIYTLYNLNKELEILINKYINNDKR